MSSNSLMKKVIVLIFLLVVLITVFVLQGDSFGGDYFSWLKTKITGMGPELNLAEKDSGLDLTDIKIENKNVSMRQEIKEEIKEEPEIIIEAEDFVLIEEKPLGSIAVIPKTSGPSMSKVLSEIEQEINQIAEEVERIGDEIKILLEITI